MEDVKIKLSALWVARMFSGLMGAMLELFEPGLIEQIIAGEMGGACMHAVRLRPPIRHRNPLSF